MTMMMILIIRMIADSYTAAGATPGASVLFVPCWSFFVRRSSFVVLRSSFVVLHSFFIRFSSFVVLRSSFVVLRSRTREIRGVLDLPRMVFKRVLLVGEFRFRLKV